MTQRHDFTFYATALARWLLFLSNFRFRWTYSSQASFVYLIWHLTRNSAFQGHISRLGRKCNVVVSAVILQKGATVIVIHCCMSTGECVCVCVWGGGGGGGVTKSISYIPLFFQCFTIVKTLVTHCISLLYLTGVAAAQLRWHQSNM